MTPESLTIAKQIHDRVDALLRQRRPYVPTATEIAACIDEPVAELAQRVEEAQNEARAERQCRESRVADMQAQLDSASEDIAEALRIKEMWKQVVGSETAKAEVA